MVKILDYKEINSGALKAKVNVEDSESGLIFNKVMIFKKDNNRWINLPQEVYESNGEKKFYRLVHFIEKERMENFQKSLFAALDTYLEKNEKKSENIPF